MDIQLAFQNADVLRAIKQHGGHTSVADLARHTGRDKSNLHKTIARLVECGALLKDTAGLTVPTSADTIITAADVAEGKGPPVVLHGDIERDPLNPRRVFDEVFISGLGESIWNGGARDGLLQPLVIRAREGGEKPYRLIAGENRWRAIGKLIADGRWPVELPVPHILRIMSDEEAAVAALVENIQRTDLSPVDEALTFDHLKNTLGWSNADIATRINKVPEYVQQRLRVLTLPEEIQARMRLPKTDENRIGFKEARKMFTVSKEPARPKAPQLSPKLALALLELALKIEREPVTNGEPGFTQLASRPTGGALATLNDRNIIALREFGGKVFAKILLHASGAVTFLEDAGFYGPKQTEVVWEARTAVLTPQKASEQTRDGRYITPELNVAAKPSAAEQVDLEELVAAADGQTVSEKIAAPANDCPPELLLIVAEGYDRYQSVKGCHSHMARWVAVTDSYPNDIGRQLARHGLGAIHTEPQRPPNAHLVTTWLEISPKAIELLRANGFSVSLNTARAAAGIEPITSAARYHTKWLTWPPIDRGPHPLANPVREDAPADPQPTPAATKQDHFAEEIADAVTTILREAMEKAYGGDTYRPCASHQWKLADDCVRALQAGDVAGLVARYARLLAASNPTDARSEVRRSLARVGATRQNIDFALTIDSPGYADAHADCYGTVTKDEDGMAVVRPDPHGPSEDEEA